MTVKARSPRRSGIGRPGRGVHAAKSARAKGPVRASSKILDPGQLGGIKSARWVAEQQQVREGIPFASWVKLQKKAGVPVKELLQVVHVKPRTLERRREQGYFEPQESERILRIERLMDLATEVFDGDRVAAQSWFQEPNLSLGDQVPWAAADTEPGARMVEDLLHQIEFGLHS